MKKLLLLLAATSMILAACGSNEDEATTTTNASPKEEKTDTTIDFMKFYLSISQTINQADADLNAFELAQGKDALPEGEELTAMKAAAKTSANETLAAVQSIEIPATLSEQEKEIASALTKMQESYTMKSEALASEGEVVLDEANAKFEEADAELNVLLEEAELAPSSILKEVSL
ncbi:hypothetical protein [Paenisporosarcina quisquiliarum]|uniref:hypothetical protein n=1 Tax=Paenisporosarcina quisquiliarum TaxID=365346 RepID=UPI00373703B2